MLFDDNNMDVDFALLNLAGLSSDLSNFDNNDNRNYFTAKEGFLRGNMFRDEYKPYKNLTFVNIKPKNEREAKLFNVMQYAFAITDLNLYLDTHPEDRRALNMLKELIKEENMAKQEYVKMYGPLKINEVSGDKFDWINGPWSWENLGGNMYV